MADSIVSELYDTTRNAGMIDRIATFVGTFWRARRGSVAIQIGLMLTVIVGMSALGTEITFLMYKHRQMQSAADSAALGAATALATGHPSDPVLEARAIAASLGFVNGVDLTTVAVNRPPLTGVHTADTTAIEVVVSQPQFLTMVGLFREGLFAVGERPASVLQVTDASAQASDRRKLREAFVARDKSISFKLRFDAL